MAIRVLTYKYAKVRSVVRGGPAIIWISWNR